MSELSKRKQNRLKDYDYSQNGAYFITICTKNHSKLFGEIIGNVDVIVPQNRLSKIGEIVNTAIENLPNYRKDIYIDQYVIMPNHLHFIVVIQRNDNVIVPYGISDFVRSLKTVTTKQIGFSLWQKSFYDHVIRNQEDYNRIVEYIENNPAKWAEDCFYI